MATLPGVPRTWVAGDVLTAAQLNAELRDSLSFLANPPACRVYHSTTQSCGDSVETTLAFNTEEYDNDNLHDNATNNSRITLSRAGIWLITGNAELANANDYLRVYLKVLKNGTTSVGFSSQVQQNAITRLPQVAVATQAKCAVSDYVQLTLYQVNSGATARNASGGIGAIHFAATWLCQG